MLKFDWIATVFAWLLQTVDITIQNMFSNPKSYNILAPTRKTPTPHLLFQIKYCDFITNWTDN